jgi:diguanylate cyclase (GGDEF)-like protein
MALVAGYAMSSDDDHRDRIANSAAPFNDLSPNVRNAVGTLLEELTRLRSELDESQARLAELERLVDEDPLLPILNRRAFVREVGRAVAVSARHGTPSCLVYIDVDGLKTVNDAYGHTAGDVLLRHVSETFARRVRASDFVGRLGGDEFGLLLTHVGRERAEIKAAEIARHLADTPLVYDGHVLPVGISYGIHALSGRESAAEVLDRADQEMYQTRRLHRQPGLIVKQ